MRSSPKIKVNPLATTNSSAANVMPLSNWNAFTVALFSLSPQGQSNRSDPHSALSPARLARSATAPTSREVFRARRQARASWRTSRCLRGRGEEPVQNLLAGPKQHAGPAADRLEHLAEIFATVRRA